MSSEADVLEAAGAPTDSPDVRIFVRGQMRRARAPGPQIPQPFAPPLASLEVANLLQGRWS